MTTDLPDWIEIGQPVAVRTYGAGMRAVRIDHVRRFTKTRIVTDSGWFNRDTLQGPRTGTTWSGYQVLEDPNDPHVVRELLAQQAQSLAASIETAARRGEWADVARLAAKLAGTAAAIAAPTTTEGDPA